MKAERTYLSCSDDTSRRRPTTVGGFPGHVWTMTYYSVVKDPVGDRSPAPMVMAADRGGPECSSLRPEGRQLL